MGTEIDAPSEHYKNPDSNSILMKIRPVDNIRPPESLLPWS
jgi:hypothetical protein